MKRIRKFANFEKVHVSDKGIGMSEEQILDLHVTRADKINLYLVAGDQRLVEITDINLDVARNIKISLDEKNMAINIPIDEANDYNDFVEEDKT